VLDIVSVLVSVISLVGGCFEGRKFLASLTDLVISGRNGTIYAHIYVFDNISGNSNPQTMKCKREIRHTRLRLISTSDATHAGIAYHVGSDDVST
jgi:hypothetical protein